MSLNISGIRYLTRFHSNNPIKGPILTFGRQMIFATEEEVRNTIQKQGLIPHHLPQGMSRGQMIKNLATVHPYSSYTNSSVVLKLISGCETVLSLDNSPQQNPEILHDLSQPVPENLHSKFGTIDLPPVN